MKKAINHRIQETDSLVQKDYFFLDNEAHLFQTFAVPQNVVWGCVCRLAGCGRCFSRRFWSSQLLFLFTVKALTAPSMARFWIPPGQPFPTLKSHSPTKEHRTSAFRTRALRDCSSL